MTCEAPGAFEAPVFGRVRRMKPNAPTVASLRPENNENYQTLLGLSDYPMPQGANAGF